MGTANTLAISAKSELVVMSYVWLQEDRDPAAAEEALCDVLALCPDNAEARRNLAVLRARQVSP